MVRGPGRLRRDWQRCRDFGVGRHYGSRCLFTSVSARLIPSALKIHAVDWGTRLLPPGLIGLAASTPRIVVRPQGALQRLWLLGRHPRRAGDVPVVPAIADVCFGNSHDDDGLGGLTRFGDEDSGRRACADISATVSGPSELAIAMLVRFVAPTIEAGRCPMPTFPTGPCFRPSHPLPFGPIAAWELPAV
jgi:hypothetical protein